MKLAVLTASEPALAHLSEAYRQLSEGQRAQLDLVAANIGGDISERELADIGKKLADADLLLRWGI